MTAIVINTRNLGQHLTGVQRYTTELVTRLDGRVRAIAPREPLPGFRGHAWEQLRLPTLVGRSLLWSPSNSGPLAVRRQVVTLHDVVPLDHPEWLGPRFAAWYRWLLPRLVRRVSRIIADSEFTRQRLLEITHIPVDRVVTVPLGADPAFRPQTTDAIDRVRKSLNIPSSRYVLSVGSLEPRKNLPRLLAAWRLLLPDLPEDVWLVLAGAPGRRDIFGSVAFGEVPPRVHWTGWVPSEDLPALYSGAMAFAYPSLYEGFGLPPLESMRCGVPPLAANVTAMPEVLGKAALLVDVTNPEEIAGGLARLISDDSLRTCLGARGLAHAAQFTWERTAEMTWAVLQESVE